MLLLWRDQLRIVLCADRVIVLHLQNGRSSRIMSKQEIAYAGSESDWLPLLVVLKELLESRKWNKFDVTIILSCNFMQFQMLPWKAVNLTDAEQLALVQHKFSEIYGEASANWEFRLSEGTIGTPSMVSAFPQDLLNHIQAIFKGSPLRLKSMQPYLMTVFNACRRELGDAAAWFVLVEKDVFCTGLLQNGQWSSIRKRRITADWFEEVLQVLEREALMVKGDVKPNKVFIYAPQIADTKPINRGFWHIQPLRLNLIPEISQTDISSFAMAGVMTS